MTVHLSEMEWLLMDVLWRESPLSASEVHGRAEKRRACDVATVRVLLDRLLKKEAVTRERKHGVWVFSPAVEREAVLLEKSRSFLRRFFDSDPVPLFAQLVRNDMLSSEDLAELRALIDAHQRREGGDDE